MLLWLALRTRQQFCEKATKVQKNATTKNLRQFCDFEMEEFVFPAKQSKQLPDVATFTLHNKYLHRYFTGKQLY